jgi:hypothetical protein
MLKHCAANRKRRLLALPNVGPYIQSAAERSPLFGKLINSKPKKIRQIFFFISGKYTECRFNPLLLLFKALLHGQKHRAFFSWHLIYILKQERFRAFRQARGLLNP